MTDEHDRAADPDRAAILARRHRFIAIALSSLAAACASRPTTPPHPCLSPIMPETQGDAPPTDDDTDAATDGSDESTDEPSTDPEEKPTPKK